MLRMKIFQAASAALILLAAVRAEAAGEKVTGFLNGLDAGVSRSRHFVPREQEYFSYDIETTSFFLGRNHGSRIVWSKNYSSIEKDSPAKKWKAPMEMSETGVYFGARFAALPGHSFAVGAAEKELNMPTYKRYIYGGTLCQPNPCIELPGHLDVHSNPFYFDYYYDPAGPWNFGLSAASEKLKLDSGDNLRMKSRRFNLTAGRSWGKASAEFSLSRYRPSGSSPLFTRSLPDNTNIELRIGYKPVKHVKLMLTAGMYTNGLPSAGGPFTDIGGLYTFDYLTGEADIDKLYSEKLGYYSLGAEITLR